MQNYIKWKQSTVMPATVPQYVRWVQFFQTVLNKDNDYVLNDVSTFKTFLEGANYSPKNIQFGLHIIRDYINYLIAVEGLKFPIHLFRIKQERSKSHHPITEGEYEKMIAVLPDYEPLALQRRLMLSMLHDTGMRGGELLNLKLKDLQGNHAVINNEKNKRQRLVAWTPETERLLKKYLHFRQQMETADNHLFVSFKWKPTRKLTTRQLERIVIEVRKKAKLKSIIRPHSFRHGFVHRRLKEGKPVTTVAQMLGHSTTMNVMTYAQLSSKEIHEAWDIA